MGRVERDRELARRRHRREKLRKLRAKYAQATDPAEKQRIKEKVFRLSPFVDLDAELEQQKSQT